MGLFFRFFNSSKKPAVGTAAAAELGVLVFLAGAGFLGCSACCAGGGGGAGG